MHFFFSGPRIFGIRPGIVLGRRDLRFSRHSPPQIEGSFVYIVQSATGFVKVGVTTDPRSRLANLQTASPHLLRFAAIAATPGTGYDIEQAAHSHLAPYAYGGEWFQVHPRVALEAILRAAAELREPLLGVTLEQVDSILAIARAAPQGAPARSGHLSRKILWILVGVLACLALLAILGH